MLNWTQTKKIAAIALGCLLAFGGWRHYARNRRLEFHMPMKTHAAGRYQLDIPEPSTLAGWGRQDALREGSIKVFPNISQRKFQKMAKDRAAALKSVVMEFGRSVSDTSLETVYLGKGTLLEKFVEGPLPNESHVLFWNDNGVKRDRCKRETYFWLQEPKNLPGDGIGYQFKGGASADLSKQQAELKVMSNEISKVRWRSDDEVPEGPGFCFQRAFLAVEVNQWEWGTEAIGAEWHLKNNPDVVISLYTQEAPDVKPEGLIARNKTTAADVLAGIFRGIRSRKRTIADYPGEEVVESAKEQNGTRGFSAIWEYEGGDPKDLRQPYIMVQMFSGSGEKEPVNSSLSEKEFLAMWDAVLESFRWRGPKPGAVKPNKDAPSGGAVSDMGQNPNLPIKPRAPLGTTLTTNERCTQTGIWECAHRDNQGDPKREFQEHQTLPEALLDTKRGLLGKLLGRPAGILVDTTWTLVGYVGYLDEA